MRAKPLAGLTVLDLTRLLPGPMCTQHLADLGADVLKVEDPAGGDYARWMGQRQKVNSTSFLLFNRNKRSLTLDLKKPEAQQILLKLAADADIVVEGFRPGVADRLGVGYAAVRALNPKVVYASITGYGQDGPWAQRAGHDMNYLAHAGVLDQTGTAGGPPALSNFQIADLAGIQGGERHHRVRQHAVGHRHVHMPARGRSRAARAGSAAASPTTASMRRRTAAGWR